MSSSFVNELRLTDRPSADDRRSVRDVTEQISSIAERPARMGFGVLVTLTASIVCLLGAALWHLVDRGIGVWGNNQSVAWAWDIAGFVFWIGIGHAGTLISAILFLFRQHWRTSINRAAEAATIFAVIAAAVYPVFHMGRVWLAYWLIPAPNQMLIWPNFKSPLTWDVFAISTYFCVSLAFWYLGMVPDLATLRDRAESPRRRRALSVLALGWRNSQRHWQVYQRCYLTLAGLGTALVISVHSIVSFDFAVSILPGWHNTIFPPYFVAGAVLSGSAMVATILVLVRRAYNLHASITETHLENLNKLILTTSWMVVAAYIVEMFLAWYGGEPFEQSVLFGRMHGPLAVGYWAMLGCNVALPQLFFIRAVRRSAAFTLVIGICVSVGMWVERFVIVVSGLDRSFLPSTWSQFQPTLVDMATLAGTFGLFFGLYLLFLRWIPIMSMSEVKAELVEFADTSAVTQPLSEIEAHSATAEDQSAAHRDIEQEDDRLLLGRCDNLETMQQACRALEETTARNVDAYAPFPVASLSRSLSVDTSAVAWSAGIFGAFGGCLALAVQYWTQAKDYPTALSGKASWSWQTAVPITFELAILGAAFGCVASFCWLCRLPSLRHPLLRCERFRSASDDGLFVSANATQSDAHGLVQALRSAGVFHIHGVGG